MKVLHMCGALDGGGVERLLLDYYRRMDHDKIRFDFIIPAQPEGILEKEFKRMESKIYRCSYRHSYDIKYLIPLRNILRKGHYDIFHCHNGYGAFTPLLAAKMEGVPIRIAHSHLADMPQGFCRYLQRCLFTEGAKFFNRVICLR